MSSSRTYGKDIFEGALQNPNNIFMTIHGGPLNYSERTINEPKLGIVPDKCVLVIITPPQAIVYSSPQNDTETYRFFQQKDWIKTLMNDSPSTCYGADNYVPSTITHKNVPPKIVDESDESDNSLDNNDTYGDDIQYGKIRTKDNVYKNIEELEKVLFYQPEEIKEKKEFYERTTSNTSEPGFELLNNIQIFLPGDEFYNQWQGFDEDSTDFDAYSLGPLKDDYRIPYTGNIEDETLIYGSTVYDGNEVSTLIPRSNSIWSEEDSITTDTHKEKKRESIGAKRVEYFNRHLDVANHNSEQCKRTTEQILNYIMNESERRGENNGFPKMIIMNSCSPTRNLSRKRKTPSILESRNNSLYEDMQENIIYRNQVYWKGRKQFCKLRRIVNNHSDVMPLLPFWKDSVQFTRIDDNRDLEYIHRFIGREFEDEKNTRLLRIENENRIPPDYIEPPQTMSDELFFALYTVAAADKRGSIMISFRKNWTDLFGTDQYPHSWNNMVQKWVDMKNSTYESSGGKKKKYKKSKKMNRKKVNKSKRKNKTKKYKR